jgi:hypothetical protein
VGFSESAGAMNEQRIIRADDFIHDGHDGGMRELIARTDDEIIVVLRNLR